MTHSHSWTRRDFVRTGVAATVVPLAAPSIPRARLPKHALAAANASLATRAVLVDSDLVREMAMRGLEAARTAGVQYADVRITRTVTHQINSGALGSGFMWPDGFDEEELAIGVRALVNGTWGYASSTLWNHDEPITLARSAVSIAAATAKRRPGRVELGQTPVVTGHWATPVEIDPFSVPIEEKIDWVQSWGDVYQRRYAGADKRDWTPTGSLGVVLGDMRRQENAIATTDGSYVTETTYEISAGAAVNIAMRARGAVLAEGFGVLLGPNGVPKGRVAAGWEFARNSKLDEQAPRMFAESLRRQSIKSRDVEIGRYDVVCDAATMCSLVDATLAQATELDRALGYEANRSGTSWLGPDPLEKLGTFAVGSPLLTLRADRTMPQGLATVKWDGETIAAEPVTLVEKGVLVDYQTTREQAAWLAPYYTRRGMASRSRGDAWWETATATVMQRAANIELVAPSTGPTFEELVAATKRGIAFVNVGAASDFQQRTIVGGALNDTTAMYEIVNGKVGALVEGATFMLNASDLWKNLVVVGGSSTAMKMQGEQIKGEPDQVTSYTVQAPAGAFQNVGILDQTRVR